MESQHTAEVENMKWEAQQLVEDLSVKQEEMNQSKSEVEKLKAKLEVARAGPSLESINQFLLSKALGSDLATFCFYVGRLGYKEVLKEVAINNPNH
ncbi:hypothetical protein ACH5RR_039339 [Cinchona calisaya]|uniref:Uncharacterized protein n=1 Tax=Cinchona calisaya TaxID=153742 RepID=A0ABD2Y0H2_9GENT